MIWHPTYQIKTLAHPVTKVHGVHLRYRERGVTMLCVKGRRRRRRRSGRVKNPTMTRGETTEKHLLLHAIGNLQDGLGNHTVNLHLERENGRTADIPRGGPGPLQGEPQVAAKHLQANNGGQFTNKRMGQNGIWPCLHCT